MTDDSEIATHTEPVGRGRANFIVRLDLAQHGMPGYYEQVWTRTEDERLFELCCLPYFTYGQSLGDILEVTLGTGQHAAQAKSGHRTIRLNFTDRQHARALHDLLAVQLGCLVEFFSLRYGAIDLDNGADADSAVALLTRLHDAGDLGWEWADPALEGSIQGRPRPSPRGRPPVAGTLEERSSTYCGNPHFRNPICVRTCAPGAARHPGIGETRGPAATSRTDPAGVRALTGDCPRHRRQASYGS